MPIIPSFEPPNTKSLCSNIFFRNFSVESKYSLSIYLLEDEISPGEIDEKEAKWLRAKIQNKGYVDKLDMLILENLRKKYINFPNILNFKGKTVTLDGDLDLQKVAWTAIGTHEHHFLGNFDGQGSALPPGKTRQYSRTAA